MKKFKGSFEADIISNDFLSLKFELEGYEHKLNLNVHFSDNEWIPAGMYFEAPHEFICPTCKTSHGNEIICTNEKESRELWKQIYSSDDFRAWLKKASK